MNRMTPSPLLRARTQASWFVAGVGLLVFLSFWTLDLQWAKFLAPDALRKMARFLGELFPPNLEPAFLARLLPAALETLAMSALGTLIAALLGLVLALPASKTHAYDPARWRALTRLALNALRSIPELVWAALLLIAAGLGPFAGTLALALHTTGVLGRLFAEAIENSSGEPAFALRLRGVELGYGPASAPPVVGPVDLDLPAGRVTAVIGANACGKSTLLRGLTRQLPLRAGSNRAT